MLQPLLRTKTRIPHPPTNRVRRLRLIRLLSAGVDRKLTLVSAPAGFGKTTLLSEWVEASEQSVGWLSLDGSDNDPARFWAHFVAALQTISPEAGRESLATWGSLPTPSLKNILVGMINELTELPTTEPGAQLVLVLDDFHVITDQQVHDSLTFLLDNLPLQLHLIICSRADPPWPLARLRAARELTEIRVGELRFTAEETSAFLVQTMELNLAPEDVLVLEERTEGWIAGLQLAALSMRGRRDTAAFIRDFTGSHRFILDYLVEEVLDRQSPGIQRFLLETSILDRMTAPLCDAVVQVEGSQAMLNQLEQANLFLVPLDEERRWYRYHHLFADLLRQQLAQTRPDLAHTLHIRASEWYEHTGLIADAVGHALSAGDSGRVAHLIEGHALAVLDQSDLRALVQRLRLLSVEETGTHPWLDIALAWGTTYAGKLQVAAPLLQAAERALDTLGPPEAARAAARIAFLRSYAAINEGDACQAAAFAREALALLPEDDRSMRAYTFSQLGAALLASGDLEGAGEAHAEAVALSEGSEDSHVAVMALCRLSAVRMLQGKLHSAASCCRRALDHAQHFLLRTGRHLPVEGYPLIRRAQLLYQWNHLGEALDHVRKGIELSRQWGQADILALGQFILARVLQASSDASGALRAIQEARRIEGMLSARASASLGVWEARLQLGQRDSLAVFQWLDKRLLEADDEIGLRYLDSRCTLARVLMALGKYGESRRLLDSLVWDASVKGAGSHVIEALALQAITLHALGLEGRALEELGHALSLAEEEGFVRVFVDEGKPMSRLLRRAVAQGLAPGYAGTLLLASEATHSDRSVPLPLEPLSERELQILRLLSTRLSAREMADELFISVNTVRSHIKTIYAKLDVHRRADAVSSAQELGLLQR